jgi:hypothetical protein
MCWTGDWHQWIQGAKPEALTIGQQPRTELLATAQELGLIRQWGLWMGYG